MDKPIPEAVVIARELARIDGFDPDDQHGGLYDLQWQGGSSPEPLGDAWNMDYLPRGERIASALTAAQQPVHEFIRFDYTNADGQPDSKFITHDEMRERYADLREMKSAPPSAPVGVERLQRYRAAANPDGTMQMHKDDSGIWVKLRDVEALAQQPAQAAPGWKLVPVEPTEEMLDSGCEQHECEQGDPYYRAPPLSEGDARTIYAAMLAAAPTPPGDDAAGGA